MNFQGGHFTVDKDVEASVRVVNEMIIINVGRISGERGYNTDHAAMAPQASWIYLSMGLIDP